MVFQITGSTIVISVSTLFAFYKGLCWLLDRYKVGEKRKQYQLMKEGYRALMRDVIRRAHKEALSDGYIDEDELEHLEETYSIYHSFKGNGTGDRWMKELRKLPRK